MAFPTLDLYPPGRITMPAVEGAAVEGGRTNSGIVNAQALSSGGFVTGGCREVCLGNVDPAAMRYWSRLGAILDSGPRSIIVPLLNDFPMQGGFSATLAAPAASNVSPVSIALAGVRPTNSPLAGSEWFGVVGPTWGNQVHCIVDLDSAQVNGDGTATYTLGIAPPLRGGPTGRDRAHLCARNAWCASRSAPPSRPTLRELGG